MRVLLLDVGGSGASLSVASSRGGTVHVESSVDVPLAVLRPRTDRVEMNPSTWWSALSAPPDAWQPGPVDAVVVTTLRQGYVLLDAAGTALGPAVLNSDRRGAAALARLRGVEGMYTTTGHWPAAELTLPKLLVTATDEPERWNAVRTVLFVHDWIVERLTGVRATEASYACAGQMADVARRAWALPMLGELGISASLLAPLVEAGARVGGLRRPWLGLPAGTPVVAGCGDTQVAALGAAGMDEGVVTVVAGSSTPVQAAAATPPSDPLRHPWLSTHATHDRWAVETNCGYPGTMSGWWQGVAASEPSGEPGAGGVVALTATPEWSERGWGSRPAPALVGLGPSTTAADIAQALAEAHAFAVRANVEDLERVLGRRAPRVLVTGGSAGADAGTGQRWADVLGRPVTLVRDAAAAGALALAGDRATARRSVVEPAGSGRYDRAYRRWWATWEAMCGRS